MSLFLSQGFARSSAMNPNEHKYFSQLLRMIEASVFVVVLCLCQFASVAHSEVMAQTTFKTISTGGHPKSAGEALSLSVPSSWNVGESASNSPKIVKVASDSSNPKFYMTVLIRPMNSNQDAAARLVLNDSVRDWHSFLTLAIAMFGDALQVSSFAEAIGSPLPGIQIYGTIQYSADGASQPYALLLLYNQTTDNAILISFTDSSKQYSFSTNQQETIKRVFSTVELDGAISREIPEQPAKKVLSVKGHRKAHGETIAISVPLSWSVEESSMPNIVKKAYDSSRLFYVLIVVDPTRYKARGYDTTGLSSTLKNPSTSGLFAKIVTSVDFHETESFPTTLCGFPASITTGWHQQMVLGNSIPIASRVYIMYDEVLDNMIFLVFTGLQQKSFSREQLDVIKAIAASLRKEEN